MFVETVRICVRKSYNVSKNSVYRAKCPESDNTQSFGSSLSIPVSVTQLRNNTNRITNKHRKGIATRLLERVCRDAAQEGFLYVEANPNRIFTEESEDFVGHAEMYEKLGFTVHKELEDRLVMRKKL